MAVYHWKEHFFQAESKDSVLSAIEILGLGNASKTQVKVFKEDLPEGVTVHNVYSIMQKYHAIKELREELHYRPGEPTRSFEIGEGVHYGALHGMRVLEILDEGQIYVIGNEKDFRVCRWFEIYKKKEYYTDTLFHEPALKPYFSNGSLSGLILSARKFGIDMNPKYQRDLVWTKEQKLDLIRSIMAGADIGKFVLIDLKYSRGGCSFEILDGKQRLSTILDFIEDRFDFNGMFFSDFSPMDRQSFLGISIATAQVREQDVTEDGVIEYFIRINTTGTPVSKEHLQEIEEKYLKK